MDNNIYKLRLTTFEVIWFITSILLLLMIEVITKDSIIGIIAAITGMINVLLVAKRSMWNYPFGIINNILYAYIAFNTGYGGDFVTMAFYYLPMQFIGMYTWKKHMTTVDESSEVISKNLTLIQGLGVIVFIIIGTLLTSLILPFITALFGMPINELPLIDAFTTFAGITAGILMVLRYSEQWYIWIAVNIGSVIMWLFIALTSTQANSEAMIVMWSAYLLNAIYGLYNWKKGN